MSLEEKDIVLAHTTEEGIGYNILPGYPTFDVSDEEGSAEEHYLIYGSTVEAFLAESFPPNDSDQSILNRAMPGNNLMVTKTVKCVPFNAERAGDPYNLYPTRLAAFTKYYRAEIVYEPRRQPENPDGSTFTEHSIKGGGEYLSLPPKKIVLSSASDPPGQSSISKQPNPNSFAPILLILPGFQHSLKWHKAIRPDWPRIRAGLGKINNEVFTFNEDYSAPPYTLLLTGVVATRRYVWTGRNKRIYPWELEFLMSERCVEDKDENDKAVRLTWNHVYHPDKGWIKVTRQNPTPNKPDLPLYDSTSFINIVTPRLGPPTAGE